MIDCEHDAPFVNVPGHTIGTAGACSKCGKEIFATYTQLLRLAAVADDFVTDELNTISSIGNFPATKAARMERRMALRHRLVSFVLKELRP